MTGYRQFVPISYPAPPPGYRGLVSLSPASLAPAIGQRNAVLRVGLRQIRDGRTCAERSFDAVLRDGQWDNPNAWNIDLDDSYSDGWDSGLGLCYFNFSISLVEGRPLASLYAPSPYAIFYGEGRKTLLAAGPVQYGVPGTIKQIASFGRWVEIFAAAAFDRDNDVDMSVVLINPFDGEAVVVMSFVGAPEARRRLRIAPESSIRVSFAECLGRDRPRWQGQVFVSGVHKVIALLANHRLSRPSELATIDHSESYRGFEGVEPLTQYLRRVIGKNLFGRK